MTWRHNVMKPGYSELRKKLAEDAKCPQCNRKSALKYYDVSQSVGYLCTFKKCRWCGHLVPGLGDPAK